ncbi:hypothetical protein [Prosthecobacter sp.]|uniref:hypothetical protein n=1 Tax=Prosthecobacter sp. TaxID=1965333 RepID=UPI003BAFC815
MLLMRPVLMWVAVLLLACGAPCVGAESVAGQVALNTNTNGGGGDEAGDLLFTARESHRAPVGFLTHLHARVPEMEDAESGVFFCGNAQRSVALNPPDKWARLAKLTDTKAAAALGLDDPLLLLLAYAELFIVSFDGGAEIPRWYSVAQADLRGRGDAATPQLLWLFDVHPSQQFREGLLFQIDSFPTINTAPYVTAARNYWQTLQMKTPPRTCYAIARLLSRHGSAEDLSILEEMKKHPQGEVGIVIQGDMVRMARRLGKKVPR